MTQKNWTWAIWVLIAAGALLPAMWNGYPWLYSDTASYLTGGFGIETPIDRAITYGLFLRAATLNGLSLWGGVIFQTAWLLVAANRALRVGGIARAAQRRTILGATVLLSSVSFITSLALTDVFTSIMLFDLFVLLFHRSDELRPRERNWTLASFLFSFAMHMSHIGIVLAALLLVALARWCFGKDRMAGFLPQRMLWVLALGLVGLLGMGVSLAKSKHVFFAARMAEDGILQAWLEEHCPQDGYALCAWNGRIERSADHFLWRSDGPMSVFPDWRRSEPELSKIIRGTLSTPKYQWMHLKAAMTSSARQCIMFNIAEGNGSFAEESLVFERIARYLPHDVPWVRASRQYHGNTLEPDLAGLNQVYAFLFACALSVLLLIGLVPAWRKAIPDGSWLFVVVFLIAYLLNAAVNASLAMNAHRFGAKMAWVITLLALTLLTSLWATRRTNSRCTTDIAPGSASPG